MPTERIAGSVGADGCWTQFEVVRTTGGPGSIDFDPVEKAGVSFCMRLRNSLNGQVFSEDICWGESEEGPKNLATNVIGGTKFTIDARGTNARTSFSGDLTMP